MAGGAVEVELCACVAFAPIVEVALVVSFDLTDQSFGSLTGDGVVAKACKQALREEDEVELRAWVLLVVCLLLRPCTGLERASDAGEGKLLHELSREPRLRGPGAGAGDTSSK